MKKRFRKERGLVRRRNGRDHPRRVGDPWSACGERYAADGVDRRISDSAVLPLNGATPPTGAGSELAVLPFGAQFISELLTALGQLDGQFFPIFFPACSMCGVSTV